MYVTSSIFSISLEYR